MYLLFMNLRNMRYQRGDFNVNWGLEFVTRKFILNLQNNIFVDADMLLVWNIS